MTKFLHWLRAARIFADKQPLTPSQAPEWTPSDASALRSFLSTHSGLKLVLHIRHTEQVVNVNMIQRTKDRDNACGYATGFRAACAWLFALSANVPPHPDDDGQNITGADDLAEIHAP